MTSTIQIVSTTPEPGSYHQKRIRTLSLLAMQDSRNAFQQNKVCNDCNWVLRSWFTCLNNINSWSVTRDASRFQTEWAGYFNLWCRDYCLFETQSTRVVTLTRPDEQQSTLIHVYTQFIDTCGHIKWTFCYACLWTTMQMWWANVRLHRTKVYYSRQVDTFFIRKTPLITSEYSDGSLMPSVVAFFFSQKSLCGWLRWRRPSWTRLWCLSWDRSFKVLWGFGVSRWKMRL